MDTGRSRPPGDPSPMEAGTTRTILLVPAGRFEWVGLRATLEATDGVRIAGEAITREQAIELAERLQPDAILIADTVDEKPGLPLARRLRASSPGSRVMVFAEEMSRHLLEGLRQHVVDGVGTWKGLTPERVRSGLSALLVGWCLVSPELPAEHPATPHGQHPRQGHTSRLTDEEERVLDGLIRGLSREDIGKEVHASVRTVARRIDSLQAKLEVDSVRAAVARGVERRLSPPPPLA